MFENHFKLIHSYQKNISVKLQNVTLLYTLFTFSSGQLKRFGSSRNHGTKWEFETTYLWRKWGKCQPINDILFWRWSQSTDWESDDNALHCLFDFDTNVILFKPTNIGYDWFQKLFSFVCEFPRAISALFKSFTKFSTLNRSESLPCIKP